MLGLTLGAIASGALVQFAPWPRDLIYLVCPGLLVLAAALTVISPETAKSTPGAWRSLIPRVHVSARVRHLLPVAAAVFLATWATGAFYQAFMPALVADQLHTHSPLLLGLVFAAYMAPSVLGAPVGGRFTSAAAQRIGDGTRPLTRPGPPRRRPASPCPRCGHAGETAPLPWSARRSSTTSCAWPASQPQRSAPPSAPSWTLRPQPWRSPRSSRSTTAAAIRDHCIPGGPPNPDGPMPLAHRIFTPAWAPNSPPGSTTPAAHRIHHRARAEAARRTVLARAEAQQQPPAQQQEHTRRRRHSNRCLPPGRQRNWATVTGPRSQRL